MSKEKLNNLFVDIIKTNNDFEILSIETKKLKRFLEELESQKESLRKIKANLKNSNLLQILFKKEKWFISIPFSFKDKEIEKIKNEVFEFKQPSFDDNLLKEFSQMKKQLTSISF